MPLSFIPLLLLCVAGLWFIFARPQRIFTYPGLICVAFTVFILPQAVALNFAPGGLSPEEVNDVLLMSALCLGGAYAGWCLRPMTSILRIYQKPLDETRLLPVALLFIACGFYFNFLIGRLPPEETAAAMWTGIVTIYAFFQGLLMPGMAIALNCALLRRSLFAWGLFAVSCVIPFTAALVYGRRETAALFILIVGMTLYFRVGFRPPRALIALVIVAAALFIPSTHQYRSSLSEESDIVRSKIDFVENFRRFVTEESILELRNAAFIIAATKASGNHEYGAAFWDELVFRYVPAQFVGADVKSSLYILDREDRVASQLFRYGYYIPNGSTITGIADSFLQFGWFGWVFFVFAGWFAKSLFEAAEAGHSLYAQLLYILSSTTFMRSVTHQVADFLPGVLFFVIFLCLAAWYADARPNGRIRTRPVAATRQIADGGERVV